MKNLTTEERIENIMDNNYYMQEILKNFYRKHSERENHNFKEYYKECIQKWINEGRADGTINSFLREEAQFAILANKGLVFSL